MNGITTAVTTIAIGFLFTPNAQPFDANVLIYGHMSNEDRVEIVAAGTLGVLLTVATPQLPRDAKIACWLVYIVFLYGLLIYKRRRLWKRKMSLSVIVAFGMLLGAISGVIAYYVFPPEAIADPGPPPHHIAQSPSEEKPGFPDFHYIFRGITKTTALEGTPEECGLVVIDAELVNRSQKNMSLCFMILGEVNLEGGGKQPLAFSGEWKNNIFDKTPVEVVNLPRESTLHGTIVFRMHRFKLAKQLYPGLIGERWEDNQLSNISLRFEDKISGQFVLSNEYVYPPAKTKTGLKSNAKNPKTGEPPAKQE